MANKKQEEMLNAMESSMQRFFHKETENKITPKQTLEKLRLTLVKNEFNVKDLQKLSFQEQVIPLLDELEQALTELEETKKINEIFKNAITIKHTGIHCEEKLDHSIDSFVYSIQPICEVIQNNIEEELKKQLRKWVLKNAFPQELKVLEIIRTKHLDLNYLIEEYFRKDFCYSDYVEGYDGDYDFLTQEEYDLLNEVLK